MPDVGVLAVRPVVERIAAANGRRERRHLLRAPLVVRGSVASPHPSA
jgi:hypothetical protein